MPFADSSQAGMSYLEESTTWGEIEGSGNAQALRYTGESLNFNVDTTQSNEIIAERQVTDLVRVNASAGGDLNIEVSYAAHDDFIEAAMLSTWSTDVGISAAATISCTATDTIEDSANGFTNIEPGQWIKVSGFTTTGTAANGVWKVLTKPDNGTITVDSSTIPSKVAGDSVTITGSYLRIGTTPKRSFTIQKEFTDLDTAVYMIYRGMRVGAWTWNIASEQIGTGSFSFMGKDSITSTTSLDRSATKDSAPTNDVMSGVANAGNIRIDGTASTLDFKTLDFTLNNALRAQTAVGTLGAVGIGVGRGTVNGNLSAYFEDKTLYDYLVNGTSFGLDWRLTDTDGNIYVVDFPVCKMTTVGINASGIDQDVMADGGFQATYDSANIIPSSMQITKMT